MGSGLAYALAIAGVAATGGVIAYKVLKKGGGGSGQNYSVNIVVVDESTGLDLDGVAVNLELNGQLYTSVSNVNGIAPFPSIPGGDYTVAIQATGYESYSAPLNVMGSGNFQVDLTPSACTLSCACGEEPNLDCTACIPVGVAGINMPKLINPSIQGVSTWYCYCSNLFGNGGLQGTGCDACSAAGGCSNCTNCQNFGAIAGAGCDCTCHSYPLFWTEFVTPTGTCPVPVSPPTTCDETTYEIPVSLTVMGSNGLPLCGETVDLSLENPGPFPFATSDGYWTGSFYLSVPPTVTTNATTGACVFSITVEIALDESSIQAALVAAPYNAMTNSSYCTNRAWSIATVLSTVLDSTLSTSSNIGASPSIQIPVSWCFYTADSLEVG